MIGEAPIERIGRPEILTVGRWWQRYVELISKLNVGGVDGHRTESVKGRVGTSSMGRRGIRYPLEGFWN